MNLDASKAALRRSLHGEGASNFAGIQDLQPAADSTILQSYLIEDTDNTYTTYSVDAFL